MDSRPKVSIVVPVYNVAEYLPECVESLLHQTLQDIEIILVDDGSTDSSGDLCDSYAAADSRVRVIHKPNGGLGFARNSGLEASNGEYVAFVDSDDYVDAETYAWLYDSATSHNLEILRFRYNKFTDTGRFSHKVMPDGDPEIYRDKNDLRQIALCVFRPPVTDAERDLSFGGSSCCALYDARLLKRSGIRFASERQRISEDFDFSYRLLQHARSFGYTPATFYHYRLRHSSLTKTPDTGFVDRVASFAEHVEQMMLSDGYPPESRFHPMCYALDAMRSKLKNLFMSGMSRRELHKWYKQHAGHPYFRRIVRELPLKRLPWRHRLGAKSFAEGDFTLYHTLVTGQERYRRIRSRLKSNV